jgi:RecA-family ATPase
MGYGPDDLDNLCYLSFPTLAHLDTEAGSLELLAAAEVYDCEVVVIDTVSRSVGGDENENDTWLNFYRHTGMKLKKAQKALIRLDHTGKDETKGQRGGSAKVGDVDAVWKMSKLTETSFRLDCEAHRFPLIGEDAGAAPQGRSAASRRRREGRTAAWRVKIDACPRGAGRGRRPP